MSDRKSDRNAEPDAPSGPVSPGDFTGKVRLMVEAALSCRQFVSRPAFNPG